MYLKLHTATPGVSGYSPGFAPYRGGWAIHITNDGKVPDDEITEGGGLSALRRRIENAGGIMRIKSRPNFALSALLPYGEENKW